jgi:hypothetical protein
MPILTGRQAFERELQREFVATGKQRLAMLIKLLGDPPNPDNIPAKFWTVMGNDLRQRFEPILNDIYLASLRDFARVLPGAAVDWNLANERAAQWALQYSFQAVKGINTTTQTRLQDIFDGFFREKGITVGDLRKLIQPEVDDLIVRMKDGSTRLLTSEARAKLIATTEVTRAASQSEVDEAKELEKAGIEMIAIWDTQHDAKVCPLCKPRDGKSQNSNWTVPPPAHPGCYCALRWVPKSMLELGRVA